jgi:adenylate cyclase
MARIHFLPDDKVVEVGADEPLLQASLRSGIPHTHVCGGQARCSTCRVLIVAGGAHCQPRNAREQEMADRLRFGPEIRLACQTTVTGDATVRRLVLDADDVELTDQLTLGALRRQVGVERRVAVLFADIRGFTAFAERLPPYDVIHALNRYFHRVERIVRDRRGYVDNYMGDGLLAIFGTASPETAPLDAVLAGLEMLEAVRQLRPYFEAVYRQSLRIGVGVHTGSVVLGSVGPPGHDRFTAIGDTVNFASRIEAATKATGTSLLVSSDTWAEVNTQVEARALEGIALPGRAHPCTLYEVTGRRR